MQNERGTATVGPLEVSLAILVAIAGMTVFHTEPVWASDTFHWAQHVPGGLEVRAVTDAAECPKAEVDGVSATMRIRALPGENYPVRVCALPIPSPTRSVKIDGRPVGLSK